MAIDKPLSEPEVRKWLKDKKLADEWWVMLDDEEFNDDPINLDEVFRIHKTLAGQQVVIVQVSEQEKDDPDFISLIMLDKPKRKPLAKKLWQIWALRIWKILPDLCQDLMSWLASPIVQLSSEVL